MFGGALYKTSDHIDIESLAFLIAGDYIQVSLDQLVGCSLIIPSVLSPGQLNQVLPNCTLAQVLENWLRHSDFVLASYRLIERHPKTSDLRNVRVVPRIIQEIFEATYQLLRLPILKQK